MAMLMSKFMALPARRKLRFFQCWLVLLLMRVALLFVPVRVLLDVGKRSVVSFRKPSEQECAAHGRELAWMMTRCSRIVPGAKCLAQALALQILLGRKGCSCDLHIGVARYLDGEFSSHAWVVLQGHTILGGSTSPVAYRSIFVSGKSA
jgi:hypothetical protein